MMKELATPGVAAFGPDRLEVAAVSAASGGFQTWITLDDTATPIPMAPRPASGLSMAASASGRIDGFYVDEAGNLVHFWALSKAEAVGDDGQGRELHNWLIDAEGDDLPDRLGNRLQFAGTHELVGAGYAPLTPGTILDEHELPMAFAIAADHGLNLVRYTGAGFKQRRLSNLEFASGVGATVAGDRKSIDARVFAFAVERGGRLMYLNQYLQGELDAWSFTPLRDEQYFDAARNGSIPLTIPACLPCTPAVTSRGTDSFDVFVVGIEGTVLHAFGTTWNTSRPADLAWRNLGGKPGGGLTACSWGNDRLDVFMVDEFGLLRHRWYQDSWQPWERWAARDVLIEGGWPAEFSRRVMLFTWLWMRDDENDGADEILTEPLPTEEWLLNPEIDSTDSFVVNRGFGGELRLTGTLKPSANFKGEVELNGFLFFYEGASENTNDLEQTATVKLVIPSGAKTRIAFRLINSEGVEFMIGYPTVELGVDLDALPPSDNDETDQAVIFGVILNEVI
jgi:hypothetical protein